MFCASLRREPTTTLWREGSAGQVKSPTRISISELVTEPSSFMSLMDIESLAALASLQVLYKGGIFSGSLVWKDTSFGSSSAAELEVRLEVSMSSFSVAVVAWVLPDEPALAQFSTSSISALSSSSPAAERNTG